MIFGIGVDIAATGRFQRFIDQGNSRLLERLFSERELAMCNARKEAASCYAARFAAKEAFLKALGTGLRDGISWHDLEVDHNQLGRPFFHLSGKVQELVTEQQIATTFLSLSHDGGNAVAMVVLESL